MRIINLKNIEGTSNREKYLQWCKDKALKCIDSGDLSEAIGNFFIDMKKNKEIANNLALDIGIMLFLNGKLSTKEEIKKFILGFR